MKSLVSHPSFAGSLSLYLDGEAFALLLLRECSVNDQILRFCWDGTETDYLAILRDLGLHAGGRIL